MNPKQSDRRRFLKGGAALAGLAAGAIAIPSANGQSIKDALAQAAADTYEGTPGPAPGQQFDAIYGVRSRYETTGRVGGIGAFHHGPDGKFSRPFLGALTPLQDVIGIITPAALHYYDSHGYIPPDIDPKKHTSPGSRHGGPSHDLHPGRPEAPARRNSNSFHRVQCKRHHLRAWELNRKRHPR